MKSMRLKLKYLIMSVVMVAFCFTGIGGLYITYHMNFDSIIVDSLESNRMYAQKLATAANLYLEECFQILEYSASNIESVMSDEAALYKETEQLKMQNDSFNSVAVINAEGMILSVAPSSVEIKDEVLSAVEEKEALTKKAPYISKPYETVTGRMIILVSYPIFSKEGKYIGVVAGTIYLKEQSILNILLGKHYYNDGSFVYVVNEEGRIIYHQDPSRINELIIENKAVQEAFLKKNGSMQIINTKGEEMLVGYSIVPIVGWEVVSQQPLDVALEPFLNRVKDITIKSIPLILLSIIILLFAAARIARPLNQLATITEKCLGSENIEGLKAVNSWYFEASYLKSALISSLTFLQGQVSYFKDQSTTDPLTDVTNRRWMDAILAGWIENKLPHAIILLDLDHFKNVNDTFGHVVGDKVLQFLAKNMKAVARDGDVCCRYGGEEFIILLPNTSVEEALQVAEDLRNRVANSISPCGRSVTLSGGIAVFPQMATTTEALIEAADRALYLAKQTGRNQVMVAG
ncbi:sensor domain-containing diguanylate cyclase [Lysinibacillus sp. NPDC048646]|uniref:sensor domain-containing diguanylate cyclase n=1 Tax=Lysinibacillus sp. NPDC048646 TaxID=3390574 RepID=UPI003CFCD5DE